MQRLFKLPTYDVHFKMLGLQTGGFSDKYTEKTIAARNMHALRTSFGSDSATLMRAQMHSDIHETNSVNSTEDCDVLITSGLSHALVMRPADCIPLVLFSEKQPLLALVHGSRNGLDEGIIEKTLQQLTTLGVEPHELHAYIGPSIKYASYVLPSDIAKKLEHASWNTFIRPIGEQIRMDIIGFARYELKRLGLEAKNISTSRIDTATHPAYYSNYSATRHGDTQGRNGMMVVMTHSGSGGRHGLSR